MPGFLFLSDYCLRTEKRPLGEGRSSFFGKNICVYYFLWGKKIYGDQKLLFSSDTYRIGISYVKCVREI